MLSIATTTPEDDEPAKGVLRWLIACDESGIDGATHYGFGSLWMAWQRRGDFQREIAELMARFGYADGEIKWNKVHDNRLEFLKALVDWFIDCPYVSFHSIVVRKGVVDRSRHKNRDEALMKHLTMLLTAKIKRCIQRRPDRQQTFRIWVDPLPTRYKKADEAMEIIANNVLAQALGSLRPVDKVIVRDSKTTLQIQICDLLLGAVMDAWSQRAQKPAKLGLAAHLATRLGWPDLRADTLPESGKFNVWYFCPRGLPREVRPRSVRITPRGRRHLISLGRAGVTLRR